MQELGRKQAALALSLVIAFVVSTTVLVTQAAGSNEGMRNQVPVTLYGRTQSPLSVFINNPPQSFLIRLNELNQRKRIFKPLEDGEEPSDAAVWIFVMNNKSEGETLPGVVRVLFESMSELNDDDVLSYVEFTLDDGVQKAALFLLSDVYPNDGSVDKGCLMAVDAFVNVSNQFSGEEISRMRAECKINS